MYTIYKVPKMCALSNKYEPLNLAITHLVDEWMRMSTVLQIAHYFEMIEIL